MTPASDQLVERLREWGTLPSVVSHQQSVEAIFDPENRHQRGVKPTDFLRAWLSMLRPFAYATKDDSWGEMEKLLCIVMRNYVNVRRDAVLAAEALEAAKGFAVALEEIAGMYDGWNPDAMFPSTALFRASATARSALTKWNEAQP